jgi:dTDP-4-amino-4,6-dideoxygalactose transaminase
MRIPLVNLPRQYEQIRTTVRDAMDAVLDSQAFIQGPALRSFESAFVEAQGGVYGRGCVNGTAALHLALMALGVGPEDEVIIPAHTFVATAEAVRHAGAIPVFVDIDPRSYTIDPAAIAPGPKTRAIIPVHLNGTPADVDAVRAIAEDYDLVVIEDAAQAHLARLHGRSLGTIGDAGTFSFFPGKNLGAYGDAGFILTRTGEVDAIIGKLINHGRIDKYLHELVGYNYRLDTLQAAVLNAKLPYLAGWTENRRRIAARYDAKLKPLGFKVIEHIPGAEPVYHLYVVEVSNRDAVCTHLTGKGIGWGIHYPVPLHLQPCFHDLGYRAGELPATERAAQRILSLPICGSLHDDEADLVLESFLEVAEP